MAAPRVTLEITYDVPTGQVRVSDAWSQDDGQLGIPALLLATNVNRRGWEEVHQAMRETLIQFAAVWEGRYPPPF